MHSRDEKNDHDLVDPQVVDEEVGLTEGSEPSRKEDESGIMTEPVDTSEDGDPIKGVPEDELPPADSTKSMPEDKLRPAKQRRWIDHPRITELYKKPDWWSLWIGLATFSLGVILLFAVPYDFGDTRVKYVVPQPMKWESNPFDAFDAYNVVGIPILLSILGCFYLVSLYAMGKLTTTDGDKQQDSFSTRSKTYLSGYAFMCFLATLAFWFGRNEWASEHGLGYAVFAIVLGMLVSNSTLADKMPWLERAAKDGEYFIKCSLVLLAVELDVLVRVGGPGMLVAWIGSPIAIVAGFVVGMKLFGCKDSLAMITSVGASWCGASAISAVAPVVGAHSEDVALAISVVAFFTILFTFIQPYLALAVGMPDDVAGAWIGASVDQTGNVIVSAAILSDDATEVAAIVKMVLNAGLGVMASIIALYWSFFRTHEESGERTPFKLIMLWDKFPKFTLGFIITSAVLTMMLQALEGRVEEEALPSAISTLNRWWFAVAFVGIGLTTNVRKMWEKAVKSGIIQVYMFANTIDVALALGLSYLVYG